MPEVVLIQKGDERGSGASEAEVPSAGATLVRVFEKCDSRIAPNDIGRPVGGAVIDDDDLVGTEILSQN
ncbi:MAG TPA: hypothetical protein VN494_09690 [Patescibacteria group bacterium]|nr:hypothetical protein [Patescibacteria group bacterium]